MQILEPQQFASWNEPIEMLYACHSKVKRFLSATDYFARLFGKTRLQSGSEK